MNKLFPLFPFAAALSLLACQNDGPVAEDAKSPPEGMVGDMSSAGLATPQNSASAEAADRAALPPMSAGMAWEVSGNGRAARFGPPAGEAQLTLACGGGSEIVVTRHTPAHLGNIATLSFTGGGTGASLPVAAIPTTVGLGEAIWQARASGDRARAVERSFARGGQVEVSLGGAPSLVVPASPAVSRVFAACV